MSELEERHQRYVEAWNQHDPAAVAAKFGPSGRYEPVPMERSFSGAALEAFVRSVMTAFPDLNLRVLRRIPAGSMVVVPYLALIASIDWSLFASSFTTTWPGW